MTTPIVVAVLVAALLHAAWNAIAHAITDRLLGFALIGLGGMFATLPLLFVVGMPPPEAWPVLMGSLATHLVYLTLLMVSYRTGDFGQVYPLARGTAPWVVALIGAVLLGEALPLRELVGVLVISAGLMILVFAGGLPRRHHAPALLAAFATGLAIASYTVVDAYGVRLTENPLGYIAWIMMLQGPVFFLVALATRRGRLADQLKPIWKVGLIGGAVSAGAYGLVLWAQLSGAVAGIAALRETSIVFAALIGLVFFKERVGPVRIAASAVVVTGVLLLTL
ncbi:DMT family transporter [Nocardiopsis sp. NPDC007018]|uniref:DMT family transporter n=1 Tax=Nocardiopsis sp. NPDC007018 TaxID=3155721 RepID=UPI0033F76F2D